MVHCEGIISINAVNILSRGSYVDAPKSLYLLKHFTFFGTVLGHFFTRGYSRAQEGRCGPVAGSVPAHYKEVANLVLFPSLVGGCANELKA